MADPGLVEDLLQLISSKAADSGPVVPGLLPTLIDACDRYSELRGRTCSEIGAATFGLAGSLLDTHRLAK